MMQVVCLLIVHVVHETQYCREVGIAARTAKRAGQLAALPSGVVERSNRPYQVLELRRTVHRVLFLYGFLYFPPRQVDNAFVLVTLVLEVEDQVAVSALDALS